MGRFTSYSLILRKHIILSKGKSYDTIWNSEKTGSTSEDVHKQSTCKIVSRFATD